jgi:hypothetical protein
VSSPAQTDEPLAGLLDPEQESAGAIVEAEEALRVVRERFERTEDPELQGELAVDALGHVERQLKLTRERRRALDRVEGKLWARRNRIERFLIQRRGSTWWHSRNHSPLA